MNNQNKLTILIFFSLAALFFVSSLTVSFGGDFYRFFSDSVFLLTLLAAYIVGYQAVRIYGFKSSQGAFLSFIIFGMTLFGIGEIFWYLLKYLFEMEVFPSIADVFFVLGYPLIFTGLAIKLKSEMKTIDTQKIKPLLLAFILPMIIIVYFNIYAAYDPQENFLNNILLISYGIGDLILSFACFFGLAIAVTYKGGKLFTPWLYLNLSFSAMLIADILYAIYTEEVYYNDVALKTITDMFWVAGYLIFGWAMYKFVEINRMGKNKVLGMIDRKR